MPADFGGDLLRGAKQSQDFVGAFERRAVDTSADFQLASRIDWPQRAEFSIHHRSLLGGGDAQIEFGFGLVGDHIRARAAANYAGIHRDSLFQIRKICDLRDLSRELENRAGAFLEVEAGVGSTAFDFERVIAYSF